MLINFNLIFHLKITCNYIQLEVLINQNSIAIWHQ